MRDDSGTLERMARKEVCEFFARHTENLGAINSAVIDGILYRVLKFYEKGAVLVDLGGGISPVNAVLSKMGMDITVVDYMSLYWDSSAALREADSNPRDKGFSSGEIFDLLRSYGVKFYSADLQRADLAQFVSPGVVDVVVSHHCIEHFSQSPRLLLNSAVQILKDGGRLVIEVPNAANARKRLALLVGRTNYPNFDSYYFSDPYLGHVREYTVNDLKRLGSLLGLMDQRIYGTNYLGLDRLPAVLQRPVDYLLRFAPSLCASLFLDGRVNGLKRGEKSIVATH